MDQTNTYISGDSNHVKQTFDEWNAMSLITDMTFQFGPDIPSGKKKRKKRWAPAANLTSVVVDWFTVNLSYTYQYGDGWTLYRDETPLIVLPSGGFEAYSGTYVDTTASPGEVYSYSMRRDGGEAVSATKIVTTWAHNFPEQYDMPESGDVKTSLRNADHSNWYLLDGRAVSSLPVTAQAAAVALGYIADIPNASECCLRGSPTYLGEITGTSNITLNRNQLPDVALTGTTSTGGSHSHEVPINADPAGGTFSVANGATQVSNGPNDRFTYPAGDHTHTVTTESINGGVTQQSIDLTPRSFNVNLFIWLL